MSEYDPKRCQDHKDQIHEINIKMTEMNGDIKHIKTRLDNGMSVTITHISQEIKELTKTILEDVIPICKDSQYWVDKLKLAIYWVSVMAVGGGFVSILFFVLKSVMTGGL